MNSATAVANRVALQQLDDEAQARCMHVELELEGKLHANVWSRYLLLQVCQEREAGTLILAERKIGAADAQLGRAALQLTAELNASHPLA